MLQAQDGERVAEAQCAQLSATLDKMLAESHDRLQSHYREKMVLVDERNRVAADADKCRKMLEGALSEKVRDPNCCFDSLHTLLLYCDQFLKYDTSSVGHSAAYTEFRT